MDYQQLPLQFGGTPWPADAIPWGFVQEMLQNDLPAELQQELDSTGITTQLEQLLDEEAAEGSEKTDSTGAKKHNGKRKRRKKKASASAAAEDGAAPAQPAVSVTSASSDAPLKAPAAEPAAKPTWREGLQNLLASRPSADELRAAGILRGHPSVDPGVRAASEAIRKLLARDALARHLRNRLPMVDLRQRGILRDPGAEAPHLTSAQKETLKQMLERRAETRQQLARYINRPIMVWTSLDVAAVVPIGSRNCHAAVLHGRRLYILGGHSEGEVEHPLSPAVLDADRGTGSSAWSRPPTWTAAGFEPVSRYAHSVVDYAGVLVLFGGYSSSSGWTNDVWLLDVRPGQSMAGLDPVGGPDGGYMGSRRSAVTMPPDFGVQSLTPASEPQPSAPRGLDAGAAAPAAQPVADLLTWHLPPIQGAPPSARAAHTATLMGNVMVVFGGNDGAMLYNDTHVLILSGGHGGGHGHGSNGQGSSGHGSNSSNTNTGRGGSNNGNQGGKSQAPGAAAGASKASASKGTGAGPASLGGSARATGQDNLQMLTWQAVLPAGAPPSPRSGHTAVAHRGSSMVVFGGGEGWGANCFNDLFVLQMEATHGLSHGHGHGSNTTTDGHHGQGSGPHGSHTTPQTSVAPSAPDFVWLRPAWTGTPPGPRTGHSACVIGDSMLVFGGFDGRRALNDLHILDLRVMVWSRPSDTGAVPGPRAGHTSTAIGSYCLVFGGSKADGEIYGDVHVLDTQFNRFSAGVLEAGQDGFVAGTGRAGGQSGRGNTKAAPGNDSDGDHSTIHSNDDSSSDDDSESDGQEAYHHGIGPARVAVPTASSQARAAEAGPKAGTGTEAGIRSATTAAPEPAPARTTGSASDRSTSGSTGTGPGIQRLSAVLRARATQASLKSQAPTPVELSPNRKPSIQGTAGQGSLPPLHTVVTSPGSVTMRTSSRSHDASSAILAAALEPTHPATRPHAMQQHQHIQQQYGGTTVDTHGVPVFGQTAASIGAVGPVPPPMPPARGGIASWPRATPPRPTVGAGASLFSTHHQVDGPNVLDGPLTGLRTSSRVGTGPAIVPGRYGSGPGPSNGAGAGAGASALQSELLSLVQSISKAGTSTVDGASATTAVQLLRAEVLRQASADESRYETLLNELQTQRLERRNQHRAMLGAIEALRLAVSAAATASASTVTTAAAVGVPVGGPGAQGTATSAAITGSSAATAGDVS